MLSPLPLFPSCFTALAKQFKEHQACTDNDCGISNVEVGPVVADDVHFEEVDDVAVARAVVEVADGSGEDEGERDGRKREPPRHAEEEKEHDEDCQYGKDGQEKANVLGRGRVFEQRERGAEVKNVGDTEDTRDDGDAASQRDVAFDPEFRHAVERQDDERESE